MAYPLETISRRMQLGALPPAAAPHAAAPRAASAAAAAAGRAAGAAGAAPNAWQVASRLVAAGGVRSLYAGVGAATMRLIPMAVCSFAVYEAMRAALVQVRRRGTFGFIAGRPRRGGRRDPRRARGSAARGRLRPASPRGAC